MNRRTLTLALIGVFAGLSPVETADAAGRSGRGGTYHYNGSYGYWGGAAQPAPAHPTAYYPAPPTYAPPVAPVVMMSTPVAAAYRGGGPWVTGWSAATTSDTR